MRIYASMEKAWSERSGNQRIVVFEGTNGAKSYAVVGKAGFGGRVVNLIARISDNESFSKSNEEVAKFARSKYRKDHNGQMSSGFKEYTSKNGKRAVTDSWLKDAMKAEKKPAPWDAAMVLAGERKGQPVKLLKRERVTTIKSLGKGVSGEVKLAAYQKKSGAQIQVAIKPIQRPKGVMPVSYLTGIPQKTPEQGERNVAAYLLSELLGFDVAVNAQSGVVVDESKLHQPVLIMGEAGGVRAAAFMEKNPHLVHDANLQRAANLKEVFDYIIMNGDGHGDNANIEKITDENGVTQYRYRGYDHDHTFGTHEDPNEPPKFGPAFFHAGPEATPCHLTGFPAVIDAKAYDMLMGLDMERYVVPKLGAHLSKEAIEALAVRLQNAKELATKLNDENLVIKDWENWTAPDGSKAAGEGMIAATLDAPYQHVWGGLASDDFTAEEIQYQSSVPRSLLLRDLPAEERKKLEKAHKAHREGEGSSNG